MGAALDSTVLIPIRDAAESIGHGELDWLAGCPNPVCFVLAEDDAETRSALLRWLDRQAINASLVTQKRARLSGALNDGLDTIKTRYVHWCGADDQAYWWEYARVRDAIGARTPVWMVGRCDTRRAGGGTTAAGLYRNLMHRTTRWLLPMTNTVGCPAVLFSADAALRAGGFDEAVPAAMDYDMWVRLHALEPPLVLPFSLGRFTVHQASLTRAHRRASLDDCYRARRRYFRHALVPNLARGLQAAQFKLQDLLGE